jgi:hypothetical protein
MLTENNTLTSAVDFRKHQEVKTMNRLLIYTIFLMTALSAASQLQAEDWMFRRSYFSHAIPYELAQTAPMPHSRSGYALPIVPNNPGFHIRGGYRFSNTYLQSGNSVDRTYDIESWGDIPRLP